MESHRVDPLLLSHPHFTERSSSAAVFFNGLHTIHQELMLAATQHKAILSSIMLRYPEQWLVLLVLRNMRPNCVALPLLLGC